jgi:hypothetical protein
MRSFLVVLALSLASCRPSAVIETDDESGPTDISAETACSPEPQPTVFVTSAPEPQPTVTVTVTPDPPTHDEQLFKNWTDVQYGTARILWSGKQSGRITFDWVPVGGVETCTYDALVSYDGDSIEFQRYGLTYQPQYGNTCVFQMPSAPAFTLHNGLLKECHPSGNSTTCTWYEPE